MFYAGLGTEPLVQSVDGSSEASSTAQHMGIILVGKMTYGQGNICKKHSVDGLQTDLQHMHHISLHI